MFVRAARLEVAEALLRERDRRIEQLEHELAVARSDLQRVVLMLGGMANRPVGKTMFDEDPFQEDSKQLDTYLSPAPDDFVSGADILQELDEQRGAERG